MRELLRSVWREPRPTDPPPARVWRDWALVAVLIPAVVLEGLLRPELPARVVSVIVTAALVPTLLWRRTHPLLMVAIAISTSCLVPVVVAGDSPELQTLGFLVLLPYALFRWGSGREATLGLAIMFGKLVLLGAMGEITLGEVFAGVAVFTTTSALGVAQRYRSRARERELEQVKLLERERLARDLHDTVAHHVSAMAIRAQAGLVTAAANPDAATDALRVIESEASRALAEMRGIVRVLRQNESPRQDHRRVGTADTGPRAPAPEDLAPAPRVADLARLADPGHNGTGHNGTGHNGTGHNGTGPAGPAVAVAIDGNVDDLPPSVATAIFRLAQESVTNARRHARHATRIEVTVNADDTSVRLRVSDDGEANAGRSGPAPGYGLIGMRERADLLGGTCEAGPNPDRGWTVTATLPRAGVAA